ncbi:hypothetical protein HK100_006902 [Physocladia obscura]|uniref:Hexosyltransferase n=1 Tax=Physocladia obscura TaxID=109957 RepID=A0AAD5SQ25_9FUNG|nr:hypothetical protein HK100_006902 [Physocladia obscura]
MAVSLRSGRLRLIAAVSVAVWIGLAIAGFLRPTALLSEHTSKSSSAGQAASAPAHNLVTVANVFSSDNKKKNAVNKNGDNGSENGKKNKKLFLDVASTGCPAPKAGLIGIFTVSAADNAARRQLLREKYRQLNANQSSQLQFDFKFVFGNAKSFVADYEIAVEETMFPDETVVFNAPEDRDSGKILDWFKYARDNMYTRHPKLANKWCLKYRYIGKGDDDAVFHLPRLAGEMMSNDKDPKKSFFVGRPFPLPWDHMTGMLYFVTADIVEWIHWSPIPIKYLAGIEDVQVGKWLLEADFDFDKIDFGLNYHDLEESPMWSPGPIHDYTKVIHWCKDMARMYRCISGLFDNGVISPEIAHRLTRDQNLKTRFKQFGILNTTSIESQRSIIAKIQTLQSIKQSLTFDEIDFLIVRDLVVSWIDKLGLKIGDSSANMADKLSKVSKDAVDAITHHVVIRAYLVEHEPDWIDDLIVKFIIRVTNIPVLNRAASWKMNYNECCGMKKDECDAAYQKLIQMVKESQNQAKIADLISDIRQKVGNDPLKE